MQYQTIHGVLLMQRQHYKRELYLVVKNKIKIKLLFTVTYYNFCSTNKLITMMMMMMMKSSRMLSVVWLSISVEIIHSQNLKQRAWHKQPVRLNSMKPLKLKPCILVLSGKKFPFGPVVPTTRATIYSALPIRRCLVTPE